MASLKGFSEEYAAALRELFRHGEPSDFNVLAMAREHSYDPEEVWEDVCEILRIRRSQIYRDCCRDRLAIAAELRPDI